MKKFYLFLVALCAVMTAGATTVYLENAANWAKVNAYCWVPENAGWPGLEVTTTITASGRTFYAYEVPGEQTKIIFNNGSVQTKDLNVEDGAVYSNADISSPYKIGDIVNGEFVPAGPVDITYATFYIPVSEWDKATCNIYTWEPALFGNWPGKAMTKVDVEGTSYWSVKVDETELTGATINWKLNAGKDESSNVTNAPMFKDGYVYHLDGTSEPLNGDVPPVVTYPDLYLVGADYGNWSKDEAYKMTREENVYTIVLPEGISGAWKIFDGTWDFSFGAGESQPEAGTETDAWFNSNTNFTFNTEKKATIKFTLVEGSAVKDSSIPSKILITEEETPVVTYPDLYLVGENFGSWNKDEAYKMTREENVYTIVLPEGISGAWKIFDGTWDFSFGAGAEQPVAGTEADAWFNSSTNFTFNTENKATIKFTLVEGSAVKDSSIASKILITEEETPVVTYPEFYLVGENFGSWNKDEAYKMTREENVYTIVLPEGISGAWKIFDGTWDFSFGAGAEQPVAGTEADAWFNSSTDFTFNTEKKATIKFTLVEGSAVKDSSIPSKILITEEETPVVTYPDLYIVGAEYGSWNKDEAYKMTREENVYTIVLPEGISGAWKIFDGTWDFSFGAGAEQPVAGTEADAWFNSNTNFTFNTENKATIKFTLVEGSAVKDSSIPSKILITEEETPVVTYPDLYIVGAEYGNWKKDEAYKMTREENVYTIEMPQGIKGEWKIFDGTDNWAISFGCGAEQPEANQEYDTWFNGANFTFNTENKATIKFTLVEGSAVKDSSIPSKLLITAEVTGVDTVETGSRIKVQGGVLTVEGAGNVAVYSADGKLMSKSANTQLPAGMYIVVVNGTANKVLVK